MVKVIIFLLAVRYVPCIRLSLWVPYGFDDTQQAMCWHMGVVDGR